MARKRKQPEQVVTVPETVDLSYIHEAIRHLAVPIYDVVPDPDNAQEHDENSIAGIQASLRRFGQDQPLVVQKQGMKVRKGNGRLLAARRLFWTHVACIVVDEGDVDAMARAIADNRTAELSHWHKEKLSRAVKALRDAGYADVAATGWTPEEFSRLAGVEPPKPAFDPNLNPASGTSTFTPEDVANASRILGGQFQPTQKLVDVTCPNCATEFMVNTEELLRDVPTK